MAGRTRSASDSGAKTKEVEQQNAVSEQAPKELLPPAPKQEQQQASSSATSPKNSPMSYKVKFTSFPENSSIKGICSVTMNDQFCVKGVKVIEGSKGLFMALPSFKVGEEYKDVCHPVTAEGRKSMSEAVLDAYKVQSEEHMQNLGAANISEGQNSTPEMAAPEGVPMMQGAGAGPT